MERAGVDEFGDVGEELGGEGFVAAEDGVHGDDVEGGVAAEIPEGELGILVDVAFSDFKEAAELRQAGEAHGDGFGGERVQDGVDAAAVGEGHDGIREIGAAGIDDVIDAERLEEGAFGGGAGGGDDGESEVAGDLDGGHADAAGAGLDEDGFAGRGGGRR